MLTGTVVSVDPSSQTGIIRDARGKEYNFSAEECPGESLPVPYSTVSFERDESTTTVAVCILIEQGPRKI